MAPRVAPCYRCPECELQYDGIERIPLMPCIHTTMCTECALAREETDYYICEICDKTFAFADYVENKALIDAVKAHRENEELRKNVEIERKKAASGEKRIKEYKKRSEKNRKRKRTDVECCECGLLDDADSFHYCHTCNNEQEAGSMSAFHLASLAICANCALRKHNRQQHETEDYSSIVNKVLRMTQMKDADQYADSMDRSCTRMINFLDRLVDAADRSKKLISKMAEMSGRTKSKEFQDEIITTSEDKRDKFTEFMKELGDGVVEGHNNVVLNKFTELVYKGEADLDIFERTKCMRKESRPGTSTNFREITTYDSSDSKKVHTID